MGFSGLMSRLIQRASHGMDQELNGMLQPSATRYRPAAPINTAANRSLHRFGRSVLLAGTDAAMIVCSAAIAYFTWAAPMRQQSAGMYLELSPLIVLFVAGYARAGLYPSLGLGPVETLRRLSYITTFGFLVVAAFSFALKLPHLYSRVTFLLAFILSLVLVPLGRFALASIASKCHWWAEPVVIIGTGGRAARAIRGISHAGHHLGYQPVAVLTSDRPTVAVDEVEGVPVLGGLDQVAALSASGIRVAFLEIDHKQTGPIVDRLQQVFEHVIVLHELDDLPVDRLQVRNLGSLVGIEYRNNLLRPANRTAKRLLDLVLGCIALILLTPVILTAALLVRLIDGGPAFYQQTRAGCGGRRIWVLKIRTMRRDADSRLEEHLSANPVLRDEWRMRYKLRDDPRVIPLVGRLFRRFSIDELPQLWAVVVGDMSLVGPRPFPDYHLNKFTPAFLEMRQRVRPGITGLWQITVRSEGGTEQQEAFDTYYVRNWSVWLDLYILGRTIIAVASGRGAY
jgi:Undecaprenyl-phosphate galactose phosphotransferase WbaP